MRNVTQGIISTVVGGIILVLISSTLDSRFSSKPSLKGHIQEVSIDSTIIEDLFSNSIDENLLLPLGEFSTSSVDRLLDDILNFASGENFRRDIQFDKIEIENTSDVAPAELSIELFDLPYMSAVSDTLRRHIGSTDSMWSYRLAPQEQLAIYVFGADAHSFSDSGRYTIVSSTHLIDLYRMPSIDDSFGRSPILPVWVRLPLQVLGFVTLCFLFLNTMEVLFQFLKKLTKDGGDETS